MMGKICSKCKIEKELGEYHKYKNSKDGVKNICKKCISDNNKKPENKEKINIRNRNWRNENNEKIKEYRKKDYNKNKEKNNHIIAWRTILNNSLKQLNTTKEGKTIELLGYSPKELKEHLEKLFVEGMSWENRNEWHIDHIKPVSSFDKSEKMCIINSLDNLQPLWALDNLKKSNKIIN